MWAEFQLDNWSVYTTARFLEPLGATLDTVQLKSADAATDYVELNSTVLVEIRVYP